MHPTDVVSLIRSTQTRIMSTNCDQRWPGTFSLVLILEAKHLECKSWLDNEVFDLVDTRKIEVRNWVTGGWVLTLKRDKRGNFLKTKARWVLRSFQDKQKNDQLPTG